MPPLIGEDAEAGLFVMAYLDPALYPVWKEQLRDGRADPETAAAVGARLARIHGATAHDGAIARMFATDENFYAIRLEPYLIATSRAHPDLAREFAALADITARTRLALVRRGRQVETRRAARFAFLAGSAWPLAGEMSGCLSAAPAPSRWPSAASRSGGRMMRLRTRAGLCHWPAVEKEENLYLYCGPG